MSETDRHVSGQAWRDALRRQADADAHDRSLIVERLAWTPEQRLAANAAFLQFYFSVRPQGPLIREYLSTPSSAHSKKQGGRER